MHYLRADVRMQGICRSPTIITSNLRTATKMRTGVFFIASKHNKGSAWTATAERPRPAGERSDGDIVFASRSPSVLFDRLPIA
jgi:hypothetical protein